MRHPVPTRWTKLIGETITAVGAGNDTDYRTFLEQMDSVITLVTGSGKEFIITVSNSGDLQLTEVIQVGV